MPTSYEIDDLARYRREFFGKYIDLSNSLPQTEKMSGKETENTRYFITSLCEVMAGLRAVALRTQVTTHFFLLRFGDISASLFRPVRAILFFITFACPFPADDNDCT